MLPKTEAGCKWFYKPQKHNRKRLYKYGIKENLKKACW